MPVLQMSQYQNKIDYLQMPISSEGKIVLPLIFLWTKFLSMRPWLCDMTFALFIDKLFQQSLASPSKALKAWSYIKLSHPPYTYIRADMRKGPFKGHSRSSSFVVEYLWQFSWIVEADSLEANTKKT